jgi:putative PIG3 family NAD(P)H quinone oxidoreductase
MRAVTIHDDHSLTVEDHPDPEPGHGECLVRVRAAGLNGADIHQRAGNYPAPPGAPQDIPGLELAGEVIRCGPGSTRFKAGDRVMAIVAGGGQAELAVVHERVLMPVPANLDWSQAGGTPEVFTTAHDALFTQAGLRTGERLLVHGAAGGVGTAAVQLGRAAGARVTATVRNADVREAVAKLGADVIAPEGFGEHGPFDVILELVGAPNLQENLLSLNIGGRIATIGIGAGAKAEFHLGLLVGKRARIHGSTLRPRPLEEKALTARGVERSVLPLLESGAITVPIADTYPLERAPEAYDRFTAGGKFGKVVLAMFT